MMSRDHNDLEMDCTTIKHWYMDACGEPAVPGEKMTFLSLLRNDPFMFLIGIILCIECLGCNMTQGRSEPQLVPVAGIRGDAFEEEKELLSLFKAHNIDLSAGGSKTYDICVPSSQATLARSLLRTNHLVLEGKVHLLMTH